MKNLARDFFSIASALAAAPLIGWAAACGFDRLGLGKVVPVFPPPFDEIDGSELLKGGIPAASLLAWLLITLLVAALGTWGMLIWVERSRRALAWASVVLFSSLSIHLWLVHDAPPLELTREELEPAPSLQREPRELYLEATGENAFQIGTNPSQTGPIDSTKTPDETWLREHADQILAEWDNVRPVRDWAQKINAYDGFDDYDTSYASPVLAFKPLRRFASAARQTALLLASRGDYRQAASLLGSVLELGGKLRRGSRSLVTLMIGVVLEKGAWRDFCIMTERYPAAAMACADCIHLLPSEFKVWDDLDRCLRNEVFSFKTVVAAIVPPDHARAKLLSQLLNRYFLNPNATVRSVDQELRAAGRAAREGTLSEGEPAEKNAVPDTAPLRFKNAWGKWMTDLRRLNLEKIAANLKETDALRTMVFSSIAAAGATSPQAVSVDFPNERRLDILSNVAALFRLNLVLADGLPNENVTISKKRDVSWRAIFDWSLTGSGYARCETQSVVWIRRPGPAVELAAARATLFNTRRRNALLSRYLTALAVNPVATDARDAMKSLLTDPAHADQVTDALFAAMPGGVPGPERRASFVSVNRTVSEILKDASDRYEMKFVAPPELAQKHVRLRLREVFWPELLEAVTLAQPCAFRTSDGGTVTLSPLTDVEMELARVRADIAAEAASGEKLRQTALTQFAAAPGANARANFPAMSDSERAVR